MKNLEKLMKHAKKIKYTHKDRMACIKKSLSQIGSIEYLIICMEEIAELTDVIMGNTLNKVDYIHTAEEIVDVKFATDILKVIYKIKEKDLKKVKKSDSKGKDKIIVRSIQTLAQSQQGISKAVRWKDRESEKTIKEKIIGIINDLNTTMADLESIYKIKNKDIEAIEKLKTWRLKKRIAMYDAKKKKK